LQYAFFAAAIQNAIETHIEDVFSAGELVSVQVTKAAMEKNESFPFVSVDLYEIIGSQARKMSGVDQIIWGPVVDADQYDAWTIYSAENIGWYKASVELYMAEPEEDEEDDRRLEEYDFSDTNYEISSPAEGQDVGPGPWAPIWQVSPPPPSSSAINLDMYAYGTKALDDAVDAFRMGLMTQVIDAESENKDSPRSVVVEPVFEHLLDDETAPIVGHIYSLFTWETYFSSLLPEGVNGFLAVLKNSCGQSFTYALNGKSVRHCEQIYKANSERVNMLIGSHLPLISGRIYGCWRYARYQL
jgi:hypothetical protein